MQAQKHEKALVNKGWQIPCNEYFHNEDAYELLEKQDYECAYIRNFSIIFPIYKG